MSDIVVPMQEESYKTWSMKHRVHDRDGNPIDGSIEEAQVRIATALSAVERKDKAHWRARFLWALQNGAVPAGRIYSNAGAQDHKNKVSLINCVVSDSVQDSMDSILLKLHEAGMSLKAGCGIGYEFSTLRPKNSFVQGAGASTSGPLSFMNIYDEMCKTVSSAGGRRGAQMATFDIKHPDVLDYITAKRENGRLENFNLSVLITDEFMEAVQGDKPWNLEWKGEVVKTLVARDIMDQIMMCTYNYAEPGFILVDRINKYNNLWFCELLRATNPCVTGDTLIAVVGRGPVSIQQLAIEGKDVLVYCQNMETGKVEVRMGRNPRVTGFDQEVFRNTLSDGSSFKANAVHRMVASNGEKVCVKDLKPGSKLSGFEVDTTNPVVEYRTFGDPTIKSVEFCGYEDVYNITVDEHHNYFILTNEVGQNGAIKWSGVLSCNCGEQPLPPYGSCLLGSINLTHFVRNAFTEKAFFDFDLFREVTDVFARMLDNVVEISELPLEGQRREILHKRRHGMGYMGLGSTLTMMRIPYGSPEGLKFTGRVTQVLAYTNYMTGALLAKEKGEAPVLAETHNTSDFPHKFNTNFKGKSNSYKGRTLFMSSHYFDNFEGDEEGARILGQLKKYGCRYSHATSIAPTGTIAFGLGNNVSNGIEPSFAHLTLRNRIVQGKATKEQVEVFSFEMLAYREYVKAGLIRHEGEVNEKNLPEYFSTSESTTVHGHIDTQAAAQEWVDSSISKTVNVPRDIPFNDFKEVYVYAWRKGLKGCATYRPNPERFAGVLVRPEDQAGTVYEFVTESGDTISVRGNEKIIYRGEEHVAANLAEAIRNGYYGRIG